MAQLVAALILATALYPGLAGNCEDCDEVDTALMQYGALKLPSWPWHRSHAPHRSRSTSTGSGPLEGSHVPALLVPRHEGDLPVVGNDDVYPAIIIPGEEYLPHISDKEYIPVVSDEEYLPVVSNEDVLPATQTSLDPIGEGVGRRKASTFAGEGDHASPSADQATRRRRPGEGDQFLENVLRDRFQILHPGEHNLLSIPRGAPAEEALLYAHAHVFALAGACSPMRIQRLDVGGQWFGEVLAMRFSTATSQFNTADAIGLGVGKSGNVSVEDFISKVPSSMVEVQLPQAGLQAPTTANQHATTFLVKLTIGDISLKVSWVAERLLSSRIANSLWLSISNLRSVKMQIGGLLGVDDHSKAAQIPNDCKANHASDASLRLEERNALVTSWASLHDSTAEGY